MSTVDDERNRPPNRPGAADQAATAMAHEAMPFARDLGVEVLGASTESVVARVAWAPERCTSGRILHGGVLMSLADSAGALLAFLNLPDGAAGTTTLVSSTSFLRAVGSGAATATSVPLHRGRTTIVVETTIADDDGRLVAKVTQTQAVLRAG
jgi:uncharacterized protein (TIGR00369 family)